MGFFIAIDGPNGVGKTSFINKLEKRLNEEYDVILTKEPSNTEFGNKLKVNEGNYRGLEYARLIAYDREFHIKKEIMPACQSDKIIITDRYIASSLALQFLDGVALQDIWELNKDFLKPSLYIILSAKPKVLEERLKLRDVLTYFETVKSRKEELDAFWQAHIFLQSHGWDTVMLNSNNAMEQNANTEFVYNWIVNNKEWHSE